MRGALLAVMVGAALAAGCRDAPEDKVKRWATEVWKAAPAPAEGEEDAGPEPAPATRTEPDAAGQGEEAPAVAAREADAEQAGGEEDVAHDGGGCAALVEAACRWLGPHTEECLEARRMLPSSRTPEQRIACRRVLEEHAELIASAADRFRGHNPCWRLYRRQCRDLGAQTWACKEARADANRLRWSGRQEACLGDLLLWEARAVLSAPAGGSGR